VTAEQIIQRVVHPRDNIAALNLLDAAERKWFYTMFLQALGRYLGFKDEREERDRMHSWARASLLHWRTMSIRIWTSQKSSSSHRDVGAGQFGRVTSFTTLSATRRRRRSARASGSVRHSSSIPRSTLCARPTRTLARPVIVLLTSGRLHAWFERHRDHPNPPAPLAAQTFGAPVFFEPQKTRAVRRAKGLIALAALASVLALIGATW
jgi:hypothetical protein